jgi:hypothetical protein
LGLRLGGVPLRLFACSLFPAQALLRTGLVGWLILAQIVLLHSMAGFMEGLGRFLRLFIASFPNLHRQRFVRPFIS